MRIRILSPKEMIEGFIGYLAPVNADNTFGNLLNKIRQNIYSFYQVKEITKNVYNNITNSIKVKYKIYTILINFQNSKTSITH